MQALRFLIDVRGEGAEALFAEFVNSIAGKSGGAVGVWRAQVQRLAPTGMPEGAAYDLLSTPAPGAIAEEKTVGLQAENTGGTIRDGIGNVGGAGGSTFDAQNPPNESVADVGR